MKPNEQKAADAIQALVDFYGSAVNTLARDNDDIAKSTNMLVAEQARQLGAARDRVKELEQQLEDARGECDKLKAELANAFRPRPPT